MSSIVVDIFASFRMTLNFECLLCSCHKLYYSTVKLDICSVGKTLIEFIFCKTNWKRGSTHEVIKYQG